MQLLITWHRCYLRKTKLRFSFLFSADIKEFQKNSRSALENGCFKNADFYRRFSSPVSTVISYSGLWIIIYDPFVSHVRLCWFNNGVFRSVVNGFGTTCTKNVCNKCITIARQADRQNVSLSKRYNPNDSGKFWILSHLTDDIVCDKMASN